MLLRLATRIPTAMICAAWLYWATAASAQSDKVRARELFNQGVSAFETRDYDAALQAFQSAYRLAPHPAVRVNMAHCFEHLGRFVEAKFNYERFLDESGERVSAEQRREVEVLLARLAKQIGTLVVSAEPAHALLRVDGQVPKRMPSGNVQLPVGRYELELSAPGFLVARRVITIEGAKETQVAISLEPDASPSLVAAPASVATATASGSESAAAQHGSWRALMWGAVGSTAVFALGLAVSGGLSLAARQRFDDAVAASNDLERTPAERERARLAGVAHAQRADRLALVSDVFLASTAAAAGATLLLWLMDRKAEKRTAMRAAPTVFRRGGGGLVLGGPF